MVPRTDQKAIRRGIFRSVEDPKNAIDAFLEASNQYPKQFVWTATVESITEKLSSMSEHAGEDSARLHQPSQQKTGEIAVHLFRGHYTSQLGASHVPDEM